MDDSPQSAPQERYEIRSKIGEGGVGAVYRAYDRSLKREVAIKRLLPQGEKPEEERYHAEEIVREAGLLSKLQHPNVVTVYDAGIDADGGFVVMELIDGETVDQTLRRGALAYNDFRNVVEQALEGLVAAQDIDMLHRDLKPSNVMIRWLPSGKFQLKLLDFGLARVTQRPTLQTVRHGDSILGSIYFMAPEQFEREPLDGRTDLYSLGCLFYYMLAGAYPFDGESGGEVMAKKLEHDVAALSGLRPDIPSPVTEWVMRMMARAPADRPASAKAALEEFEIATEEGARMLDKKHRNPLLAPALVGKGGGAFVAAAPPPPATAGAPVAGIGTTPLHTTSHYLQPPGGSKKKNRSGTAIALGAAAVLTAVAAGGWYIWDKGQALPKSTGNWDTGEDDEPAPEPPQSPPDREASPPQAVVASPEAAPATPPAADATVLVPLGAAWKYSDNGAAPGQRWRSLEFDDADWASGPAPIGYGDALSTEISFGGDSKNKHISYFFRHRFEVPDTNFASLRLRYQVDDGCIIYLNGKQIDRLGMGDTQWPAIGQLAERKAEGKGETEFHETVVENAMLAPGPNVLAVRVHQSTKTSSDIRLDLELAGIK